MTGKLAKLAEKYRRWIVKAIETKTVEEARSLPTATQIAEEEGVANYHVIHEAKLYNKVKKLVAVRNALQELTEKGEGKVELKMGESTTLLWVLAASGKTKMELVESINRKLQEILAGLREKGEVKE